MIGGDSMKLIAYCIGLSQDEIDKLKAIRIDGRLNVYTYNQVTTVHAAGRYDEMVSILAVVTSFKVFEAHLT